MKYDGLKNPLNLQFLHQYHVHIDRYVFIFFAASLVRPALVLQTRFFYFDKL